MAVIQPDVEQILASLSLLELAAGITHCRSGAAQASTLTAGVNQHHLDVDSFKTCILVRDFSTTNPSMWHFYIYREIFGDYPLTFVTVAACVRVLFPSSSYVVKRIVKKRQAEAFEVCQLQDPIKYQMHVFLSIIPTKLLFYCTTLYVGPALLHTQFVRIWHFLSVLVMKKLQLFTSLFLASHVYITKIFSWNSIVKAFWWHFKKIGHILFVMYV